MGWEHFCLLFFCLVFFLAGGAYFSPGFEDFGSGDSIAVLLDGIVRREIIFMRMEKKQVKRGE